MIKCINQWSMPDGMTLREMMDKAVEFGFEAFEPAFSLHGELSADSTDAEILAIRSYAESIGLKLSSLASGLSWKIPPTSADPAVREEAVRLGIRQIECARMLGVGAVLVVPGTVGSGFWGGDEFTFYEDAWKRAVAYLRALVPAAKINHIVIGVENVWNNLLVSPQDMLLMIREADSAYVQAYLDVGNVVKFGWPEMWVRMLRGHITRVHVKDFHRDCAGLEGFCALGEGDVNYPAVMHELMEAGYDGYITAEMTGSNSCTTPEKLIALSETMDAILSL